MNLIYIGELNLLNLIIGNMGWRAGYLTLAACVAFSVLVAAKIIVWSPEKKEFQELEMRMRVSLQRRNHWYQKELTFALL